MIPTHEQQTGLYS